MTILVYALYAVMAYMIFFGPKPESPKSAALEDFELPSAEEGRAISVVLGTREIKSPNVVWYGDLSTKRIKKRSLFSSTTIGHKYYLGVHMVVCNSGIDAIHNVHVGDKLLWEGSTTGGYTTVNKGDLFGGEKKEGGITGTYSVELGKPSQKANTYLASQLDDGFAGRVQILIDAGVISPRVPYVEEEEICMNYGGSDGHIQRCYVPKDPQRRLEYDRGLDSNRSRAFDPFTDYSEAVVNIPNYRGVVSVILQHMYVGTSAYPKPWKFLIKATEKDTFGSEIWYKAKSTINSWDMNPAHVLYLCLTNPHWGLGVGEGDINQPNFRALADLFYEEGFGLSFLVNVENPIQDFISDVLKHINGVLRLNKDTGAFEVKLIRADYEAASLELFDATKISEVKNYQRTALADLVNALAISYWDRELGEVSTYRLEDLAAIAIQGGVIEQTIEFSGITNKNAAAQLAARDLATLSSPLTAMELEVNRYGGSYNVGDVILVTWPQYHLENVVFRIVKISLGEFGSGDLTLHVVEDVFGEALAMIEVANPPVHIYDNASPLDLQHFEEASYPHLLYSLTAAEMNTMETIDTMVMALGNSDKPWQYGFMLNADFFGVVSQSFATDFTPVATMVAALDREDKIAHINFGMNVAGYSSVALIDDEYIMITGYDSQGRALLKRGIYDTQPTPHTAESTVWLMVQGDYALVEEVYPVGGTVDLAGLTIATAGTLSVDHAIVEPMLLVGRAMRPYPPANVQIAGAYWPEFVPTVGPFVVSWQPRDKVGQIDAAVDWFLNEGTAEAGMTYNIRVYDGADDSLIEEATGLTALSYSPNPEIEHVRIELESQVNGVTSRLFSHSFHLTAYASGYGYDYGDNYGGTVA